MVSSRKQRARNAGTFLESVKQLLQELAQEVADVKATVHYMSMSISAAQFAPLPAQAVSPFPWGAPAEQLARLCSAARCIQRHWRRLSSATFASTLNDSFPVTASLVPAAEENVFSKPQPEQDSPAQLQRDSLLQMRCVVAGEAAPDEIFELRCRALDDSSEDDAPVAPVGACSNFFDDLAKNVQHPEFMNAMSAALSNIDISAALEPVPAENTSGSSGFPLCTQTSWRNIFQILNERSVDKVEFYAKDRLVCVQIQGQAPMVSNVGEDISPVSELVRIAKDKGVQFATYLQATFKHSSSTPLPPHAHMSDFKRAAASTCSNDDDPNISARGTGATGPVEGCCAADESLPEFSAQQMRAIIDMVILELPPSEHLGSLPADVVDGIASKLKSFYTDEDKKLYSKEQARDLMVRTGEMCGEAAASCAVKQLLASNNNDTGNL